MWMMCRERPVTGCSLKSEWNGRFFTVIDTGGIDPTASSRQAPLSIGSADFIDEIRTQAAIAVGEADAVLFLVDAKNGVTPADLEVAHILRRSQKKREDGSFWPPIFLVVNKADNAGLRDTAAQFYELGMGDPYPISAMHGTGTGDLLDDVVASFPELEEEEEDDSIKIAIVGKPNVGKSESAESLDG